MRKLGCPVQDIELHLLPSRELGAFALPSTSVRHGSYLTVKSMAKRDIFGELMTGVKEITAGAGPAQTQLRHESSPHLEAGRDEIVANYV